MKHNPNHKGDREKYLRNKFAAEWEALPANVYEEWIQQACDECKVKNAADLPSGLRDLLICYAWTLFAEDEDPDEAKRISRLGSYTTADAAAGQAPLGGW